MAKNVVVFINDFPPKSGLSTTYIPHTIMAGKALYWKKIFKLHLGTYAQEHEDRNFPNTLEEMIPGEICLGPIGNL